MSSATSVKGEPNLTDATLMTRIRNGDQSALSDLYDRYSQVVYSVALRVLGDTSQAEDVLQDIFMQIWRNPSTFDASRGSLGAWLAVISRHRAIDALRRRRPETDISDITVSFDADLDRITDRNMAVGKIRKALEELPKEQKKLLEMAFFEGLTHAEIAQRTGEPLGTVKTRIRTGLITLRKVFAA
jgi:RNA polymerase sigma-70 factor (ECF subfamily)